MEIIFASNQFLAVANYALELMGYSSYFTKVIWIKNKRENSEEIKGKQKTKQKWKKRKWALPLIPRRPGPSHSPSLILLL
jgi:hypothetical protein